MSCALREIGCHVSHSSQMAWLTKLPRCLMAPQGSAVWPHFSITYCSWLGAHSRRRLDGAGTLRRDLAEVASLAAVRVEFVRVLRDTETTRAEEPDVGCVAGVPVVPDVELTDVDAGPVRNRKVVD